MFRLMAVILVAGLSGLAAFAAGASDDLPAIVEIPLVACMALFFGALLASTSLRPSKSGRAS